MLREIFLTITITLGLLYAIKSARGSVLILLWIGFQRPYDFSWGMWNDLPTWKIAFVIAFLSNLARQQLRPKHPAFMVLFLLLIALIMLTCVTGFSPAVSWAIFNMFMFPLAFGMWVVAAAINDLGLLKYSMWVTAGSLGINGAKTGVALAISGGGAITTGSSGFVGDNNVFGLVLCLAVAMLLGLRTTMPKKRWLQIFFYTCLFFTILTILFTKSRGALLSLGVIMFMACLLGGKPVRHLLILFTCAAITYAAVPSNTFDRLDTLKNVEGDASAMGRIENWKLSWEAAESHPILGIGIGNHIPYHKSRGLTSAPHVAHSLYFQTVGELSFIGLILLLLMLFLTLFSLWAGWRRYSRLSRKNSDLLWLRNLYFWLFCGFVGYMFGAAFLNTLQIEFPWYVMLYVALLRRMSRQAEQPPAASPANAGLAS